MSKPNETKTTVSCFDEYAAEMASKKPYFFVRVANREFVFRNTRNWAHYKEIRDKGLKQVDAIRKNVIPDDWKSYVSDLVAVLRAVHMSERHVGFRRLAEDADPDNPTFEEIEDQWGTLQFLKMADFDPHSFQALVDALDSHIGRGWEVSDLDRFL